MSAAGELPNVTIAGVPEFVRKKVCRPVVYVGASNGYVEPGPGDSSDLWTVVQIRLWHGTAVRVMCDSNFCFDC